MKIVANRRAGKHALSSPLSVILQLQREQKIEVSEALSQIGRPNLEKMPRSFRKAFLSRLERGKNGVKAVAPEKQLRFDSPPDAKGIAALCRFLACYENFEIRFTGKDSEGQMITVYSRCCTGVIEKNSGNILRIHRSSMPDKLLNIFAEPVTLALDSVEQK